jgi:hypothetical protein
MLLWALLLVQLVVTYEGKHNHPPPPGGGSTNRLGRRVITASPHDTRGKQIFGLNLKDKLLAFLGHCQGHCEEM